MDTHKTFEDHRNDTKKELLKEIEKKLGADGVRQLEETLSSFNMAVIGSALNLADENPAQFTRFLDGVAALGRSLEGRITGNDSRPVERTITKLRVAAQEIGFGKFVSALNGRQEDPTK